MREHRGLRLGVEQEKRLRAWPKDRIRPKSIALGVISLLAEVDYLRQERDAIIERIDGLNDGESLLDAIRSVVAEWEHFGRELHRAVDEAIPTLTAERDAARQALDASERRGQELREALLEIRTNEGKVCQAFELCRHAACMSSCSAWFIADAALGLTQEEAEALDVAPAPAEPVDGGA